MGSVLHGSARTTPRVRAELQGAQASTRALAAQYGVNPKTVSKWRRRMTTRDARMGPRCPRSMALSPAEGAMVVEVRRRTLLPLDDLLGTLRGPLPRRTRSALHRCLQRHGVARLPQPAGEAKRGRFTETRPGYVHLDSCELRWADGKAHLFLAVDRVTKFTYVALHDRADTLTGAAFLRDVVAAFPYRLHTVLTDNGVAFTDRASTKWDRRVHVFARVCREHAIEHRRTKAYRPWTNGQAERMVRTVKDATVKVYHCATREALAAHVQACVTAYNFARHLKRLRWRTPFESVCDHWRAEPAAFRINPHHLIPGPHT